MVVVVVVVNKLKSKVLEFDNQNQIKASKTKCLADLSFAQIRPSFLDIEEDLSKVFNNIKLQITQVEVESSIFKISSKFFLWSGGENVNIFLICM